MTKTSGYVAAVSQAPCRVQNENMFSMFKEGVETMCKHSSLKGLGFAPLAILYCNNPATRF